MAKTVYRKPCPRCGDDHSRRGQRYCDPCERIVIKEMAESRYLEDRHIKTKQPNDRLQISQGA
jgi:hypothetical protein